MSTKATTQHQQQHHQQHQQQHQQQHHQHQQQHHQHQHQHHQQQHQDQSDADTKKNTEKNRKISQYSRDIHNMGHSHFAHSHNEKDHKKSKDGSDIQERPERQRKISHHSRDGTGKGHHHHTGRPRAGSKREHDRHSVATSGDLHPPIEYENTYKIEPDSVFSPGQVKEIIRQVLHENLSGRKYVNGMMGEQCASLSDKIKERVLQLNLHRFKIVATVLIGQRKSQSMMVSSRCLWNQTYDNFASCEFNKDNLYAVGMVFGVYQE